MDIEVHIKSVVVEADKVVVMADANLWKDKLRIYQVTDAAIAIMEAG